MKKQPFTWVHLPRAFSIKAANAMSCPPAAGKKPLTSLGKRGRPKNPETKKITQQPAAEQKPLTASQQNPAAEIVITKVAKQESDKKIYKIKDYVIYPKHGVGQIVAIENSVIADIEMTYYKIQVTKDKLTLTIPVNQQGNLRPISSVNQIMPLSIAYRIDS